MNANQNVPTRDLSQRLTTFAAQIIRLAEELPVKSTARKISDQLMRSAMSVGANYEEARGAESKADFTHKLAIALKEMRETRYWLCLIVEAGLLASETCNRVIDEATQLRAILAKSVATAKGTARPSTRMEIQAES